MTNRKEVEPSKVKVIVVDDSEFSRMTIGRMLTQAGFTLVGDASNAQDAVNLVSQHTVHIAIIDIVMPEINGIELSQVLTKRYPDLKVIMISSLGHDQVVVEAISAGAVDFVKKPFETTTLIDSVMKVSETITID